MILQDDIVASVVHTAAEQQEMPLFPIAVTDTCLIAQYPVLYEGPYMEDGSNEYVVDVAAMVLFNTARTGLEEARVVLRWDGGEYVFKAQMLPPRSAVMVLDQSRQKFAEHSWTDCFGMQKIGEGEWLKPQEVFWEEIDDTKIMLRNETLNPMQNLRIYYKSYLATDSLYLGGITYCAGVEALNPGEQRTIRPYRYVKDYAKIVRITYSN